MKVLLKSVCFEGHLTPECEGFYEGLRTDKTSELEHKILRCLTHKLYERGGGDLSNRCPLIVRSVASSSCAWISRKSLSLQEIKNLEDILLHDLAASKAGPTCKA